MGLKHFIIFAALSSYMHVRAFGAGTTEDDYQRAVLSIEKSIVDLTDPTALLRCEQFRLVGQSLNESNAVVFLNLITSHKLTGQQEVITALLTTYLPQETFWKVTIPILNSSTNEMLQLSIIACPLPYGPGFANAYQVEPYKAQLESLLKNPRTTKRVKLATENVLSGNAAKAFQKFKKDPSAFGYSGDDLRN